MVENVFENCGVQTCQQCFSISLFKVMSQGPKVQKEILALATVFMNVAAYID